MSEEGLIKYKELDRKPEYAEIGNEWAKKREKGSLLGLFFSAFTPVLAAGNLKQLAISDLLPLPANMRPSFCREKLARSLKKCSEKRTRHKVREHAKKAKGYVNCEQGEGGEEEEEEEEEEEIEKVPTLFLARLLLSAYRWEILILGALRLLTVLQGFAGPLLIGLMVAYVQVFWLCLSAVF